MMVVKKHKKKKQKQKINKDKSRYFDFYDDVKHSSHRDIAW